MSFYVPKGKSLKVLYKIRHLLFRLPVATCPTIFIFKFSSLSLLTMQLMCTVYLNLENVALFITSQIIPLSKILSPLNPIASLPCFPNVQNVL